VNNKDGAEKYTMFKTGVITDEISQDFEQAIELACKYRLDGLEIRSVWEKLPHQLTDEDIQRIKMLAAQKGLEICAISSPFFKCDINDRGKIIEHIEILKKTAELAHRLGVSIIRGFTFLNTGDFNKYFDRIIDNFIEPVKILERENLVMALETERNVHTTTASKLVKVLEKIGSPYVKALWDPGNTLNNEDGEFPFPDGYETIKPYMVHMHLKDRKIEDGILFEMPLGEGDIDYGSHFKKLIEDGYKGYVVLETHYRKNKMSEELMANPKGTSFSEHGYEATEECLLNLSEMLDNM
jgi:L-ribulose-5-phosphate 3-epimerase